jgi:hypothetical protein
MIRREFLGNIASSGLPAAFPSVGLSDEERSASSLLPVDDTWDLSWYERLKGKSRAVFDSPRVSEGGALYRAVMWRDQYANVFGANKADLTPVLVFRHEAIPLIMDDEHSAHIIPGVILQPSGFFAVLKAQDEGCNCMMGS